MKNNKKAFTILEMILYMGILSVASIALLSTLFSGVKENRKTTLFLEQSRNIATSERHLAKATENINNVLLISHKQVGTHFSNVADISIPIADFNQHTFTMTELIEDCGFVMDDNYDLIAFESKDNLDPIIIGVRKSTTASGREYHQLAIYKYYSTTSERERIEKDVTVNNISNFLDGNGQIVTEGLTAYKCNPNNGFIIPISSKFYLDEQDDFITTTFLKRFKVVPYVKNNAIDEIQKYGVGLIEMGLDWETRENEKSTTVYHSFSKTFNY